MTTLTHLTEKAFQAQVRELLALRGFRLIYATFDSRRSPAGFPDLVAIRHDYRGITLAALELKSETGLLRAGQLDWLDGFAQLAVHAGPDCHVVTGLFRPSDFSLLATLLQERQP